MKLFVRILSRVNFYFALVVSLFIKPLEQLFFIPLLNHIYYLLISHPYELITGAAAGALFSLFFNVAVNLFPLDQVCSGYIAVFGYCIGNIIGLLPALSVRIPQWQLYKEMVICDSVKFIRFKGISYGTYVGMASTLFFAFPTVTAHHDINFALNTYKSYSEWCSPSPMIPAWTWAIMATVTGIVCSQILLPTYNEIEAATAKEMDNKEGTSLQHIASLYGSAGTAPTYFHYDPSVSNSFNKT
jgi:hypothetical protein